MRKKMHLLLTVVLFGLLVVACEDRKFEEFCKRRQVHADLRNLLLPTQNRYVLFDSTGLDSIVIEVVSSEEQRDCGNNDRQGSYQLVVYSSFTMRVVCSNSSLFDTISLFTLGEGCMDRDCYARIGLSSKSGMVSLFDAYFAITNDSIRVSRHYQSKLVVLYYDRFLRLNLASDGYYYTFDFISGRFLDKFCFDSRCFRQL